MHGKSPNKRTSGSEGNDVLVEANAASVRICVDGTVDIYSAVHVRTHPSAGDVMADGTICAGISPDTGKPLYTARVDAPLTRSFNEAQKYAEDCKAHGHADWRLPTKAELNVMFNNRAAIGGFSETGSGPSTWYWSSTTTTNLYAFYGAAPDSRRFPFVRRFTDGLEDCDYLYPTAAVRCVRG